MDKDCMQCGKSFKTTPSQVKAGYGRFCCKQCAYDYRHIQTRVEIICKHCGKSFVVPVSRLNYERDNTNYCSKQCRNNARTKPKNFCIDCGKELSKRTYTRCSSCANKGVLNAAYKDASSKVVCEYCNKEFIKKDAEIKRNKHHYCSDACCSMHRKTLYIGLNSSGKTKFRYLLRTNSFYSDWRNLVFKRDNYTCQRCGATGGYIEAHHIVELATLVKKHNVTSVMETINISDFWDIDNGITLCKVCHKQEHKDRRKLDGSI